MKPLNPPCRCLPLSCPSDGQDYWVVLLAAGLWQRHVGSFPQRFLRVVVKTAESCFPCQGFGAEVHRILCQAFTATIPWAFFPAWFSPCPTVSYPCPINSLSFSSSLSLLCQPAVVISFPFLLENPKSWQNSGLLSPGFWMGRSCKELEKDYISLTLIFQFPCWTSEFVKFVVWCWLLCSREESG